MFLPYSYVITEIFNIKLFQCLDSGWRCNKRKTRSKNIFQYMEIYKGPDMIYDLSWLYADSLNVVFIACFYGIGMPIMFPIAAIILLQ